MERFEKKKNAERRVMITSQHTFADELQQLRQHCVARVAWRRAPARGAAVTVLLAADKYKVRGRIIASPRRRTTPSQC